LSSFYTAVAHDLQLLHPPRLAAIEFLAQLAGPPPARVVDVAAGSGGYAALLQHRGFQTYAIEVNAELCTVIRERHPDLAGVIHGDMLEVFDLVRGPVALANCIGGSLGELGSLGEVADVIGQLLDLCGPQGTVVLDVPNFDHLRAQREQVGAEWRCELAPISAYREDGSELRLEQHYAWLADGTLLLRRRFSAPEGEVFDEQPLLELGRDTLAGCIPADVSAEWYGDWHAAAWCRVSGQTIAVLKRVKS